MGVVITKSTGTSEWRGGLGAPDFLLPRGNVPELDRCRRIHSGTRVECVESSSSTVKKCSSL